MTVNIEVLGKAWKALFGLFVGIAIWVADKLSVAPAVRCEIMELIDPLSAETVI